MKKFIFATLMALATLLPQTSSAQGGMVNHAFSNNEILTYNLYFNWKFVWVPAGTASLTTTESNYKGQRAYRSSLITRSSAKVDKVFMMRDTLLVYATKDLAPLYYRKGSHEGDRYYVDEVFYSYPNGKCAVTAKHLNHHGVRSTEKHTYSNKVYDMLNIFLRARNFSTAGWKKGHTIPVDITGFSELVKAKLVYQGKSTVKADNSKKYDCLELSYIEKEGGKDKEIVRFFVTDDEKHVPIRIDLFLKFGSAKAFLKTAKL